MASAVVMPKLGNSVESSIIASWKKKKGDKVSAGDVLVEIETDARYRLQCTEKAPCSAVPWRCSCAALVRLHQPTKNAQQRSA